ncbi:SMP-30/gluconolactonase/LRE family protein [Thalassospira povalilytica]|uniref:SMP-30/gluconolactonase/LRE family protein n=1 Tax=Thalassospira povalilytica TaxID=732237 RepID=UPI001D18EDB2|nr:SMP-30/gluconolactonase/LRE family protein [Thalassospira povalilytica]MCC4238672.1 SMP-30/gluconolactonase/LRE family protein [Thalassospira povalilytica]
MKYQGETMANVKTVLPNLRCTLGEGPHWDAKDGVLYWVDIVGKTAFALRPSDGASRSWTFDQPVAAIVPRENDGLLVALADGLAFLDAESGETTPSVAPDRDHAGNRSNESRVDPAGRFWHGTMQNNIGPNGEDLPVTVSTGTLNRVGPDGETTRFLSDIGISNTLLWSADGKKMFFGDTIKDTLNVYDYDMATGVPSNPRVFFGPQDRGNMDGSAMDADGYIWNARWGGSCLIRFAPDGSVDQIIDLPVTQPTSCVFGGPDLKTLYITSASVGLDGNGNELEGALLSIRTDVAGQPCTRFAG